MSFSEIALDIASTRLKVGMRNKDVKVALQQVLLESEVMYLEVNQHLTRRQL